MLGIQAPAENQVAVGRVFCLWTRWGQQEVGRSEEPESLQKRSGCIISHQIIGSYRPPPPTAARAGLAGLVPAEGKGHISLALSHFISTLVLTGK